MKKQTMKIAFGGVMAALSLVILLLSGILPTAEIALPALAGFLLLFVVIELGKRAALLVYAAVSLLALFLVPSWEPKLLYIAFFGYYPILKSLMESHLPRHGEWVCKLGLFNAATIAAYWVLLQFLGLPTDSFIINGMNLQWVFLLMGNGIFLLFDFGLTRSVGSYLRQTSPAIRRLFRF